MKFLNCSLCLKWDHGFSMCYVNVVHCLLSCLLAKALQSYPTLCDPQTTACQASLSITISWSLPKLMSIESVMPSNHFILCCPLLFPPSIFPSIRMSQFFASGGPKYWSFSFSISPSNRYSGFISFRMD